MRLIEDIKAKPAAERRRIALTVTFAIALFLLLILFFDMKREISKNPGESKWWASFQNLKAEVIEVFESK